MREEINHLKILKEPEPLIGSYIVLNGYYHENVEHKIENGILHFKGDRIHLDYEWDYSTDEERYKDIENRFIKDYFYPHGWQWKLLCIFSVGIIPCMFPCIEENKEEFPDWLHKLVKIEKFTGVHGRFIWKGRSRIEFKTSVWTLTDERTTKS